MDVFHPASYTVDHLLLGVQMRAILRLRTRVMQSLDCAHMLHKLRILRLRKFSDCMEHTHYHTHTVLSSYTSISMGRK